MYCYISVRFGGGGGGAYLPAQPWGGGVNGGLEFLKRSIFCTILHFAKIIRRTINDPNLRYKFVKGNEVGNK